MSISHGNILKLTNHDVYQLGPDEQACGNYVWEELGRQLKSMTIVPSISRRRVMEKIIVSRNLLTIQDNHKDISNHLRELIILEVNEIKKAMSKNFDLTEEKFEDLVRRLKQGDNSLLEQVFLIHFDSCIRYVQKKFSCVYDEAYDVSMEALLLFRQKLVDEKIKYGNLHFLFTQMAIQIMIKKNAKKRRELDHEAIILSRGTEYDSEPDEESYRQLQKSWNELGLACQDLLRKIYYGKMRLNQIAKDEQKTDAAIRKQKQRCIGKLRNLLTKNTRTQS